jgi:methylmalonyl-CoA mutase
LLDGVFLDLAPVTLEGDVEAARAFLAYAADRELHPATNLGSGVSLAREAQQHAIRSVIVDADTVHDRGASDVQELAWALAQGVEALRIYAGAGFEAAEAARQIEFRLVATDEQFPTIAKFRAARRLWARVLELSGAPGVEMAIHAVTSRPMMSAYDPHTNMLRTTVAAFAAGVGGADAVTVLPFDEPLGAPTDFSRRIARNTSALLIDESHVAAVSDPAGGAYAVERLTADLAQAAWDLFVRLDDEGFSLLDDLIETVATERERQVALRTRPITGLSEFPQSAETRLEREPVDTTPVRRWGAAFEALRDDPRGSVWLAPLGTIAAHTARATFAGNLFAAGGVAITNPGPLLDVEALAAAYDGSPVVCLVGADAAYAEWGADAIAALRKSGAKHVILAGKPGDRTVAADLIDDSCAMGVDAIAFLTRTREASA